MLSQVAAAWSVVLKDEFITQVDFLIQMLYLCLSVFLVFLIDSEQKTRRLAIKPRGFSAHSGLYIAHICLAERPLNFHYKSPTFVHLT